MAQMNEIEISRMGDTVIDVERMAMESSNFFAQDTKPAKPVKDSLQILAEKELKAFEQNLDQPFTIFRVPKNLREKASTLYEPSTVSIGPCYHGKEELRPTEEHKRRCLQRFLDRNKDISLEVYLEEMRKLEKRARNCYSESFNLSSDQFVFMLLLDGCFILMYFLMWAEGILDPFFDARWATIGTDILLFENQIPFFIIHKLGMMLESNLSDSKHEGKCSILYLIFDYYSLYTSYLGQPELSCDKFDHLLHFYYESMVPQIDAEIDDSPSTEPHLMKTRYLSWLSSWFPQKSGEDSSTYVLPPSVTVLYESGVTFRRKINPRYIFDITFHDGVMEMPLLRLNDANMICMTNVRSYEQSPQTPTTFASYATLMDLLIDTGKDVAILKNCGIIESFLESDEDTAAFFNRLADGCSYGNNHYFARLFEEVIKYSNSTWPRYRATLMHDYFTNPWTSISVFVAVLLLGLTVTQTYYSVYSASHN